jgi:DNA-binding LacI/PurR family transcriptional regulator
VLDAVSPRAMLSFGQNYLEPGHEFDDEVALRVLAAAGDLGLAVPGDLAVIGFDATGYGALSTPALTTVHIDVEDHGRRAARIILGLDSDGFTAAPAQVLARESA